MVHSDGETTMLGQWRVVLRQAEEAERSGRLDEALALASRPDVADHFQLVQLRSRATSALLQRAGRRAKADDLAGALDDIDLAERHQVAPDLLAAARHAVGEHVESDVHLDLEAGEPARALERIADYQRRKVSRPGLRRLNEIADSWQRAIAEARRGEFAAAREALDRARRLAGSTASDALAATTRELELRHETAAPRVDRLYAAIGEHDWSRILAAAEAVLEIVPEHPAARQARTRAWRQMGVVANAEGIARRPAVGAQGSPLIGSGIARRVADWLPRIPGLGSSPEAARAEAAAAAAAPERSAPVDFDPGRFLLWVDGVGGYLVCPGNEVLLGRAALDGHADVAILGDLSRRHATLVRQGEGYLVRAHAPTFVNNAPVQEATLHNGDVIRLGASVELEFRQPSPISTTARLELVSRHRLPVAVDGVILMGETCLIGASAQAHVPAPALDPPIVVFRQASGLKCRAPGDFEVDGKGYSGRAPLTLPAHVMGEGFSFSLEPLPQGRDEKPRLA